MDSANDDIQTLPYRPCVGIALFNDNGEVFVGERLDNPGAWQMPQGGIDKDERVEDAALRELKEEIGTDKAEIIEVYQSTLTYELPRDLQKKLWQGRYRGQEQYWVAMRFKGNEEDINLDAGHEKPEFSQWQWISLEDVLDSAVPFKRDVYEAVVEAFSCYSEKYKTSNR